MSETRPIARRRAAAVGVFAGLALLAAACSSSGKTATGTSSSSTSGSSSSSSSAPAAGSASSAPGASFATAQVPNVGTVLVDGRGRTVYLLTSDGHTNVPCEDSNGCTGVWPDLPLPSGVTSATAGAGVDASKLGTKQVNNETYPTYNGWLLYEFAGDGGPGQAKGQGISSFGGTWYTINAAGDPVMGSGAGSGGGGSSSSSGY